MKKRQLTSKEIDELVEEKKASLPPCSVDDLQQVIDKRYPQDPTTNVAPWRLIHMKSEWRGAVRRSSTGSWGYTASYPTLYETLDRLAYGPLLKTE